MSFWRCDTSRTDLGIICGKIKPEFIPRAEKWDNVDTFIFTELTSANLVELMLKPEKSKWHEIFGAAYQLVSESGSLDVRCGYKPADWSPISGAILLPFCYLLSKSNKQQQQPPSGNISTKSSTKCEIRLSKESLQTDRQVVSRLDNLAHLTTLFQDNNIK